MMKIISLVLLGWLVQIAAIQLYILPMARASKVESITTTSIRDIGTIRQECVTDFSKIVGDRINSANSYGRCTAEVEVYECLTASQAQRLINHLKRSGYIVEPNASMTTGINTLNINWCEIGVRK